MIYILDGEQFSKVVVYGDGNCLFRAISMSLFGTQAHFAALRRYIVNHMESREHMYGSLVDNDFASHMVNMKKCSGGREIWATEAEIQAAGHCRCYNRSIWLLG